MKNLKTILLIITVISSSIVFTGCNSNQMVKKFGGKDELKINGKEKFVNITWKENDLWIVTRERKPGEQPEKYFFYEKSGYGIAEGQYTIVEEPSTLPASTTTVKPAANTAANSAVNTSTGSTVLPSNSQATSANSNGLQSNSVKK